MRWNIPASPNMPNFKHYRLRGWLAILSGFFIISMLVLYQLKSTGITKIKMNEIANTLIIINILAFFAFTFWITFLYLFNQAVAKSILLISQQKVAIQKWAEHKTSILAFSYYDSSDLQIKVSQFSPENKKMDEKSERITFIQLIKKLLEDLNLWSLNAEQLKWVNVIFISDKEQQLNNQKFFEALLSQLKLKHIKIKKFTVINQDVTQFFAEHDNQIDLQHTLLFIISSGSFPQNEIDPEKATQSLHYTNNNSQSLVELGYVIESDYFATAFWFYNSFELLPPSINPIGFIPRIMTTTDKDLSTDLSHLAELQAPSVLPKEIYFCGVSQEVKINYLLNLYSKNYLPQEHVIQQSEIQSLNNIGQFNDWHVFAKTTVETLGRSRYTFDENVVSLDYQLDNHHLLVLQSNENIVNISLYLIN